MRLDSIDRDCGKYICTWNKRSMEKMLIIQVAESEIKNNFQSFFPGKFTAVLKVPVWLIN